MTAYRQRVVTIVVAVAALVAPAGLLSSAAAADGKVPLGGGAGIALNGDTLCTLTTIGTDRAGDLIGFTSAHCGGPGAVVAAEHAAGTMGSVVAADDGLDYAVIKFDPAKVVPVAKFADFVINGIGPDPRVLQWACKQSRATGHDCFSLRGGAADPDPSTVSAKAPWQPDDDGARSPSTIYWSA